MRRILLINVYLIVFTIPFERAIMLPYIGTLTRLLGIILFVISALYFLKIKEIKKVNLTHFLLFLFFFIFSIISMTWSNYPEDTFQRAVSYLQLLIFIVLMYQFIETEKERELALKSLILGSLVLIIGIIFNYLIGNSVGSNRFSAFENGPITSGLIIATTLPIAFHYWNKSQHKYNFLYLIYVVLGFFSIFLTGSRTAYLAVIVAALFMLASFQSLNIIRKILIIFVGVIMFIIIIQFIPQTSLDRLLTLSTEIQTGDMTHRTVIWQHGFDIFKDNKFFGIGVRTYAKTIEGIFGRDVAAHNIFITMIVEVGMVGTFLFLLILYSLFNRTIRYLPKERLLWMSILLIWLISASGQSYWEYHKLTWFIWGIVLIPYKDKHIKERVNT